MRRKIPICSGTSGKNPTSRTLWGIELAYNSKAVAVFWSTPGRLYFAGKVNAARFPGDRTVCPLQPVPQGKSRNAYARLRLMRCDKR
jgi:hypothetical protein